MRLKFEPAGPLNSGANGEAVKLIDREAGRQDLLSLVQLHTYME